MKILLTLNEVTDATGFSATKINRLILEGRFPKSIKIDGNTRWRVRDLNAWEEALCDEQVLAPSTPIKRGRPRLAL
jgi:predicted DNA-binding transcriptional regulator AlpA